MIGKLHRLGQFALQGVLLLGATTSIARAHGQEVVLYFLGGAALAQIAEGVVVIALSSRSGAKARSWALWFFVVGVIAAWWFTIGSNGLQRLIAVLETNFGMPDSIETPLYWVAMLSGGPLFAAGPLVWRKCLSRYRDALARKPK